ncbi:hypothetical protein AB4089_18040 [Arthrobacter sp. 2MCAF15]|uniref:hypothetical protein n=1 Tax=Arthrobacter sp. 2MCAF15 TaxID=3232984 RepID=UPI003F918149
MKIGSRAGAQNIAERREGGLGVAQVYGVRGPERGQTAGQETQGGQDIVQAGKGAYDPGQV